MQESDLSDLAITFRGCVLLLSLAFTSGAFAASDNAKTLATTVCVACHGTDGISVGPTYPHLAGQRAAYLAGQLRSFRKGTRKSDLMNVIAAELSDDDITGLAEYFATRNGPTSGAKSRLADNFANTHVTLPPDFRSTFKRYLVKNLESDKVGVYYANTIALRAAAKSQPLPDGSHLIVEVYAAKLGDDKKPVLDDEGRHIPDRLMSITGMGREVDWGKDIPVMLRNENWNYGLFDENGVRRTNVNQAECFVCHKTRAATSYLYLMDKLESASHAN
jgi:cytochrome c553